MSTILSSAICRYCGLSVSFEQSDITIAYFNKGQFYCHKACKKEGERQEAFECQVIDANCNDCKFYQRQANGRNTSMGFCAKLNKQTTGSPNKWMGMPCFEHRRSNVSNL